MFMKEQMAPREKGQYKHKPNAYTGIYVLTKRATARLMSLLE